MVVLISTPQELLALMAENTKSIVLSLPIMLCWRQAGAILVESKGSNKPEEKCYPHLNP